VSFQESDHHCHPATLNNLLLYHLELATG